MLTWLCLDVLKCLAFLVGVIGMERVWLWLTGHPGVVTRLLLVGLCVPGQ